MKLVELFNMLWGLKAAALALLSESPLSLAIALVITALWSSWGWVRDKYKNYDRLPRRHMIIRLKELRECMGDDAAMQDFIDQLERVEVFHAATKIRVDLTKIIALTHLCKHGFLSPDGLKGMVRFVDSDCNGMIRVNFGVGDCIGMILSISLAVVALFIGFASWLIYIWQAVLPGLVAGFLTFMGFLVAAIVLAGEAGIYRKAKQLKKDLEEYELPICQALIRHKKQPENRS